MTNQELLNQKLKELAEKVNAFYNSWDCSYSENCGILLLREEVEELRTKVEREN